MIMIKAFTNKYEERLLQIFDSNIPSYFDPSERDPFINFIRKEPKNYYVIFRNEQIVGAGGFIFKSEEEGRIVWLMVDQALHSKGVGSELMNHFENEMKLAFKLNLISLMTSQHTDKFYEKLGYQTTRTENDYWAKGMHLYYMEKQTA